MEPTCAVSEASWGGGGDAESGETDISCPASRTIAHSSGNVSSECPGMNHVAFMLYFSNSFSSRRVPMVPAHIPREMSLVESSPP